MGVREVTDGVLEFFFPPACIACDAVLSQAGHFCEDCGPLVEEIPDIVCRRCGEPGRFADQLCPRCSARAPGFTCAYAPFEHVGAIARAIHRFKYDDHPELARPLAALLREKASPFLAAAEGALCPIPLHERRYRERRYDQATLLATELAHLLQRPLFDSWLRRVKDTERQVGLSDAAREDNVRGAFLASPQCSGASVVLVDDVLTTGATAREAARAMLEAGARKVSVITVARATRESL